MRILIIGLFFISALVSAQTLHTFSNGEVADADKVNQNFDHLTVMAQEANCLERPTMPGTWVTPGYP